jgi:hypothetical protein
MGIWMDKKMMLVMMMMMIIILLPILYLYRLLLYCCCCCYSLYYWWLKPINTGVMCKCGRTMDSVPPQSIRVEHILQFYFHSLDSERTPRSLHNDVRLHTTILGFCSDLWAGCFFSSGFYRRPHGDKILVQILQSTQPGSNHLPRPSKYP